MKYVNFVHDPEKQYRSTVPAVRPLSTGLQVTEAHARFGVRARTSTVVQLYSCTRILNLQYSTVVQGLADARKRARRSGLVQFFAVYQFDRGGILQMCHTVGELCNHAVRGSMVWRQTSDTICEFTVNSVF